MADKKSDKKSADCPDCNTISPDLSKCTQPKDPPPMTPNQTAKAAEAMGMGPCIQGSVSVSTGGIGPLQGPHGEEHFSIGCEQASLIMQKYQAISQQLSCMMDSMCSCSSVVVNGENKIKIVVGRYGVVDCPMNVNQNIKVKLLENTTITGEMTDKMQQVTTAFAKAVIHHIQDSQTKGDVNPQGSKAVTDINTQFDSTEVQQSVKESMTSALTSVSGSNSYDLTVNGKWMCHTGAINITQNVMIDAAVSHVLSTGMKTLLGQNSVTKYIADIIHKQKSVQQAAEKKSNIVWVIIILLVLAALGYWLYVHRKELKDPIQRKKVLIKLAIWVVVIIVVLVVIYFILHKIKSALLPGFLQ